MKNLRMNLKSRELYIYIAIIAVQVLVMLYWGRMKTNYFIDDLYSMGYASSFIGGGDTAQYITTSPDFSFNEWIRNSALKKYLIVSDEETVFNAPFFKVMQKFITGRNYFGFLNIAESIAGYSFVSSRPGILLNIFFLIVAEISLISLMKKLSFVKRMSYLSLAMFGFSCYVISAAEYIRFYMLVIMIMIVILNLLYRLWNSEQWKQILFTEVGIMILSYLAYKNSELTLVYFGAVMGSSIIAFFLMKKWRQFISCVAVCLCGAGYILVTTNYIGMLLHPDIYSTTGSFPLTTGLRIAEASFDTIESYLYWVKELFETYYFGSYRIIYLMVGALTICLIIVTEQTDNQHTHFDIRKIRPVTIMAIIIWTAMLAASHIFGKGYNICALVLCLIMFLAVGEALGYRIGTNKMKNSSDTIFVLILASAMGIYTIFCAMAGFNIWRYYCYGFVSGTIIVWYVIDRLFKKSLFKKAEHPLYIILTGFIVINALIPFRSRNIEYIYEDETEFVENIENNKELDVVLFLISDGDGTIFRHELYDCVNLMSEDSNIYCVDLRKYEYSLVDYPDEFVLWSNQIRDLSIILEELDQHGYDLWNLGSDHCSKAYVCKLR